MKNFIIESTALGEPFAMEATNKKEAISKMQEILKPVFGKLPANRFKAKLK